MAIIVDKEQKRRDIALACKNIVLENGIDKLSVASLAKEAGIGKGTIYEYFKTKEEIVFAITSILMQEHSEKLHRDLEKLTDTKAKVKRFSAFFFSEEEKDLREIYKEFIALSLRAPTAEMLDFQTESFHIYYDWFKKIIEKGIENQELKPESIHLCVGIFVVAKGMFVVDNTTRFIEDLESELHLFIDTLFKLMEVSK